MPLQVSNLYIGVQERSVGCCCRSKINAAGIDVCRTTGSLLASLAAVPATTAPAAGKARIGCIQRGGAASAASVATGAGDVRGSMIVTFINLVSGVVLRENESELWAWMLNSSSSDIFSQIFIVDSDGN